MEVNPGAATPIRPLRLALLAALCLLAVLAEAPTPAGAATSSRGGYWTECGDRERWGIENVKSHKVDCTIARRVAKHYWRTRDHHFGDWTCRSHQDEESYRPACRDGGQVVKFRVP